VINTFVRPNFGPTDKGNGGGIRRVVEAQLKHLPALGYAFTDYKEAADLIVLHGGDYYARDRVDQTVANHCHGLYWDEYSWHRPEYDLNKFVVQNIKEADVVTAPTQWVANAITRGTWRECKVLPNGIETDEWAPAAEHSDYVLWNKSRVDPICEIDSLVQLARKDQGHSYVTTIGPDANVPANMKVVGLQPYSGPGSAAQVLVANAGVYLATARETFGIGTLEALACGVPIVGWNWGGQGEFVKHRVHGWLCAPGDVDGLREGVEWCLAHRDAMQDACLALAKQFEWSEVMQQYDAVYKEALAAKNTQGPRVTVVIPSYNLSQYLEKSIESAATQVKPVGGFEVLVVDDNSTDGSYELATKLAGQHKHMRVVKTPQNLHLAGTLNYGISQARGEYIFCLDADNSMPQGTLNLLSTILDSDPSLDIAYGRIKFITEGGEIDLDVSPDGISTWPPMDADYRAQLIHKNQIPSSCLYRKKVWSTIGGYRRRCRTAEDADFWCRALLLGFNAKRVVNTITLVYRTRAEGMSIVTPDWPWERWYGNLGDKPPFAQDYEHVPTNEPTLISVVIPVGPHHADLLLDALDTLWAQTYRGWECIIVNDSGAELPWTPAWAKVISTGAGAPKGVSAARNLGLQHARGHVFMPLDADDFLAPQCLERMWSAYQEHKGYVYSDYLRTDLQEVRKSGADACAQVLDHMPHPLTGLYPLSAWQEANGFDEALRVGEDWDFVAHITSLGYCGTYVPEPLIYYRTESGGNREALLKQFDELEPLIKGRYGTES
jgi:glycosyltransferase involved in cell wall biosynthesis